MQLSLQYAAVAWAALIGVGEGVRVSNGTGLGIALDTQDPASIKQAAAHVVDSMLTAYYNPKRPGLLPGPYSWWQGGALMGGLVDYWAYTRDDRYVDEIGQALVSQAAPSLDFNMPNEHSGMGNDDEGFWALAAMAALEEGLPVPAGLSSDLWFTLTNNVFNDYVTRWNASQQYCNGGLRWQVWSDNTGYDYKNSIANGVFMQLAARLGRYTGNTTYNAWASTVFDWMEGVQYIDQSAWLIYDGGHIEHNCTDVNHATYSYNPAIALYTAAVMYNMTTQDVWHNRMLSLINGTAQHFFTPYPNATDVMFEAQCETFNSCDTDQYSFKGFVSRWFAKSALIVPEITSLIQPLLNTSAVAAAQACSGLGNNTCGFKWYVGAFDGKRGLGQDISAYETFQSLLVFTGDAPQPGTAPGIDWSVP